MADFKTHLDTAALRAALSSYMTGVTVVTCIADDGSPVGFTANSFTSVSLDPPLLLICPGNHLSSYETFANTTTFAVNILAEDQEHISNRFARSGDDRFAEIDWRRDINGCPVFDDMAATFSCSTHTSLLAGDHTVLIGQIDAFAGSELAGLGYGRDGYFNLTREQLSDASTKGRRAEKAGVIITYEDTLLLLDDGQGLQLPTLPVHDGAGARTTLSEHLAKLDVNVRIGPVYSAFDVPEAGEHRTYFRAVADQKPTYPTGKLIALSELTIGSLARPDEDSMVQRFRRETSENRFGLYLGDSRIGEVHPDENQI